MRSGAASRHERDTQREVAQWIWDFVASCIGPGGGVKLVDGELCRASDAVRALQGDPSLAPYQRLAARLAFQGDQSAVGLLLAAGIILETQDRHVAQSIDGILLARRQLLGWLEGQARPSTVRDLLAALDGSLAHLVPLPDVELDHIDVKTGPVHAPTWSPGLWFDDSGLSAKRVTGGVLLVSELLPAARQAPTISIRDPAVLEAARQTPQYDRLRAVLQDAGVTIVLSRKSPDEDLAAYLTNRRIFVAGNVERSMAQRVAMATGCTAVPHGFAFQQDDLGQAEMVRIVRGSVQWRLQGAGKTATIEVPVGPDSASRIAQVEKWLRAVAPITDDPRALPGGGAWQREGAAALRAVADLAPGKAPIGMQSVARALERVANAIVRNAGHDPSRTRHLEHTDAMACVRPAVASALEVAVQLLRIDARHSRRASNPTDLRGGAGPAGSPRGMPGDIPPLM